jgi:DNA helicase MCM8
MFLIYIDAVSVVNERKHSGLSGDLSDEFSEQDLFAIQAIASEPNVFGAIVNSLCPTIFGHELVKAGLILALFGGCPKFESDRNKVSIRGDPHVLVCGDPGLGKSQVLFFFSQNH